MDTGCSLRNPHHTVVLSRLMPGIYIGTISAGNDSVYIEPVFFHHESTNQRNVLVFRTGSLDGTGIFRSLSEYGLLAPVQDSSTIANIESVVRRRRQVVPRENEVRNRCPLKIVA
ncbi:hypothetical protein COOONC_00132, partial [Cooperia oncophora]